MRLTNFMGHPSPKAFKLKMKNNVIFEYKNVNKANKKIKTHIMFNYGLFQDPKQAFQVILTSLSKFSKRQQNTASRNLASNLFMNTSMMN